MVASAGDSATLSLSLPEELLLMLLNEETGYFHQVPGWALNCAVIGAVLAELSLLSRIDTDLEFLFVVDATPTGDPILDHVLQEIADETEGRNAQYWVERLAPNAEDIIDSILERLVDGKVLVRHDGDYWTLSPTAWRAGVLGGPADGYAHQFVKTRISDFIFNNIIPEPRDIIIISLVNCCDVLRFMYLLDDDATTRIRFICNMDLIGRSIADAVTDSIVSPGLRRSALVREIPTVSLRRLALNRHLRNGNLPALFADLAKEYGPVFQVRPPFAKRLVFLAGPETNRWAHRNGRMYLRARDYFEGFEKLYGASGVLPSLDGGDHFRLRKSLQPAYSRERLSEQLDQLYSYVRTHMANWAVGDTFTATDMSRYLVNAQLSPLFISIESQDILGDLMKYKERALSTHVARVMPRFMLNTPSMRRRTKGVDVLMDRVRRSHTPAQRAGRPRDLADDLLSLNVSDPQLVPESNLRFAFSAALIASVYLGDALSFAVYAMASQPELYEQIRSEADALFDGGDPNGEDFNPSTIDVTHRFLMECLRMHPIVPMSLRNVMNSCEVEGHFLPVGERITIAQTAAHYMDDVFPDPFKFDIDRYRPPRNEHLSPGYAPYGVGTHICLGQRWMELQLAINVLMIAHHFTLEVHPTKYREKIKYSPLPSMKPSKKVKFRITEQRREIPA
ncbi:MAG: cytochrome P450 [Chloroflexota bacterium]|nr:cytochrome P450 [Chloroflexota bacterium]